jgi:hypothetical protein
MLKLNILCTRLESHYSDNTCINNENIFDSSEGAQEKRNKGWRHDELNFPKKLMVFKVYLSLNSILFFLN